jgi:hypothetical protein
MMLRSVPLGDCTCALQMEFLDPRLVGRNAGAFDADAVLLDRLRRLGRWAALGGST